MNGFKVPALFGGQGRLQQQADHRDHTIHRRADFMAHGGQKIRFGPHRGLGLELCLGQTQIPLVQFIVPVLRIKMGQQAQARDRLERFGDAIGHSQIERPHLARQVSFAGQRNLQVERQRSIIRQPPQQFESRLAQGLHIHHHQVRVRLRTSRMASSALGATP